MLQFQKYTGDPGKYKYLPHICDKAWPAGALAAPSPLSA